LFLGQRDRAWNKSCFREIGDFIAHRDKREKGLVTQVGRDVFTSLEVWSLGLRGRTPSLDDIERAARANLRLASDEQLKTGCGCRRPAARTRLERALDKIKQQAAVTDPEARVLEFLGNRFIWKPAFTANQLFDEFCYVLIQNGIVRDAERPQLEGAREFLILHALAVMHGSAIVLESGQKAALYAGFANRQRRLEVKVQIAFHDLKVPVLAPICLFYTELDPQTHCAPNLLELSEPVLVDHWNTPIEIGANGLLSQIS